MYCQLFSKKLFPFNGCVFDCLSYLLFAGNKQHLQLGVGVGREACNTLCASLFLNIKLFNKHQCVPSVLPGTEDTV